MNSCSNRDYLLFEEYKVSFYNWNLKYSPTTQLLKLDSSFKNKKEFSDLEYISDLKRFLIELNQIDINKVGKNNFLAYKSIKEFLNKEIYLDKTMKFNQWNSLYYLNIFYDHSAYISSLIYFNKKNQLRDFDIRFLLNEVDFLTDRIDFFLESIKYKHSFDFQHKELEKYIQQINDLSSNIFYKEVIENPNTLLSRKLTNLKESIDNLTFWYNRQYEKLNLYPNSISILDYKKYFHLVSDDKKDFEEIVESALLKLESAENKLFDLCLPIYLEKNDEPIWTDFSDTISVISTVFEEINSSSYQCSNNEEILKSSQNISSLLFDYSKSYKLDIKTVSNLSLSQIHAFDFYNNQSEDFVYVYSSNYKNDRYQNYYYNLDKIIPGDFFLYDYIYNSNKDFNSIYLNRNYFYAFKSLLKRYYLNIDKNQIQPFQICGLENFMYFNVMNILNTEDELVSLINVIASIKYLIHNEDPINTISKYDRLKIVDEIKNNFILKDIFNYKLNSIIKFTSSNLLENLLNDSKSIDYEELLNIFYEHPNASLDIIIKKVMNE
ncbi:MAG: hypothetical protein CBD21_00810 [bacterium TMED161]|nr:hypothetical protein [Candidatus Neomarinimicrobiota bacterium]OUW21480.1 MAG: hypothetical protein CBD21_00810 [bacterium TMED161]